MKNLRRRFTKKVSQLIQSSELKDSKGRTFDPEIYRTAANGEPLLTRSGSFWLKPGKRHAD